MIYLTLPELMHVAERTLGSPVPVRDPGLLQSALARPQATAFGVDAYATLEEKAAALLHSLARNHALVDGNKRLALAGTIAFLGVNGRRLTLTNDEAYDLVMAVATGELDEIPALASRLKSGSRPGKPPPETGNEGQDCIPADKEGVARPSNPWAGQWLRTNGPATPATGDTGL